MNRRAFLVTLGGGLVAAGSAAAQPGKVVRIGYLSGSTAEGDADLRSAFRQGLAELGYVEGKGVALEFRYAALQLDRIAALYAELVQSGVDVIVVSATAALDARTAPGRVPAVFVTADDPVRMGLVASMAQPGGHMTGLTSLNVDLDGKRLEILKATLPTVRRVSLLTTPQDRAQDLRVAAAEQAARALAVQIQVFPVASMHQLAKTIDTATRSPAEALMVVGSPFFFALSAQTAHLIRKTRLPAVSAWREFPAAGGLLSYGTNVAAMFRRAALFVHKILKGAKPGELPVEQAISFELVINLKTARSLGLTIPPSLLLRADQVIE